MSTGQIRKFLPLTSIIPAIIAISKIDRIHNLVRATRNGVEISDTAEYNGFHTLFVILLFQSSPHRAFVHNTVP